MMNLETIAKHIASACRTAPKLRRLEKATQDVEAIFLKDLLKAMRRSLPKTDLGGQGMGKEIYEDLMDQALAETASKRGTFGLGNMLYKRLAPSVARAAWAKASLSIGDAGADETRGLRGVAQPTPYEPKSPLDSPQTSTMCAAHQEAGVLDRKGNNS